jgi:(2R)-sulfolactate sulfo-lyase subunit alpha
MGTLEAKAQADVVPRPGAPHFLVHNEGDDVAVAVQDVEPGQALIVFMDSERAAELEVVERVPLGHKVALSDLEEGADLIEYGVPVGRTRQPVRKGQWVHVHNLRSRRWESSE